MKKALLPILALALAIGLAVPVAAHTENDPLIVDLLAGQTQDVGEVRVWNDGANLHVEYVVDDTDWYLTETHLHVANDVNDIPQTKKGNPKQGKFDYKNHDIYDVTDEYVVPLADFGFEAGDNITIAAHAVVETMAGCETDISKLEAALPDQVTIVLAFPGGDSYFNVTISGGTIIDGVFDGFCIDTDHSISPGTTYIANVYSSYETLPMGLVEFPENLDLVNYILNQNWYGQTSPSGGTYTYGDIQRAIWALIEDNQSTAGIGPWSQARVDEILADAYANGEGFIPGCGEYIAIVLAPIGGQQPLIVLIPFYGFTDETAWADGTGFSGNNWATYFNYTIQYLFFNKDNIDELFPTSLFGNKTHTINKI